MSTINAAALVVTMLALAPPPAPGPSPTMGAKPPALDDRTAVLFDGRAWEGWATREGASSEWALQKDGSVQVQGGDAITRREFGEFQLLLEFLCQPAPEKQGQARSNSGVYLHGRYEVQVLDSFGEPVAPGSCGGLYSIAAPLVNAARPPGEWQTYDIVFRAARFQDGQVAENARVTDAHNGVVIHNNLELPATTPGGLDREVKATGPLLLQDHGDPVRYRNIWVREL